jgi:glycosyltransferase involved in cell wall biosynthesis
MIIWHNKVAKLHQFKAYMKVTIAQGAFLPIPPLRGGAIEKAWFALGKEFVRRGHQVTHISRSFDGLPATGLIEGVRHLRLPGFDQPQSRILLKLEDLIYSMRVKGALPSADILVTNTFWLPILVRDSKFGAIYVHVGRYPQGQMALYRHVARLQTVSKSVAQAIASQCPKVADKVSVIPYPISDDLIIKSQEPPPLVQRDRCILYAGRLHKEKGLRILISAFTQLISRGLRGWKLVIVGPWQSELGGSGEEYFHRLQSYANTIQNYVEFPGMMKEGSRLRDYYQKARLFVYPSLAEHGESFGLAPLEAMANGCPPLVSSLDCFSEFVREGETGFIFDHRRKDAVQALADKISMAIQSDQLQEIASRGRKLAEDFTVDKVADRLLADFASLASAKSSTA